MDTGCVLCIDACRYDFHQEIVSRSEIMGVFSILNLAAFALSGLYPTLKFILKLSDDNK
jgi:hypothetical protein